jgi:hypothetical protein
VQGLPILECIVIDIFSIFSWSKDHGASCKFRMEGFLPALFVQPCQQFCRMHVQTGCATRYTVCNIAGMLFIYLNIPDKVFIHTAVLSRLQPLL